MPAAGERMGFFEQAAQGIQFDGSGLSFSATIGTKNIMQKYYANISTNSVRDFFFAAKTPIPVHY